MKSITKEKVGLQALEKFQEQLKPISEAFEKVVMSFDIKNDVTIKFSNGNVRTFINVEDFRKD